MKIAGRASGPGGDIKTVDVVKPLRPPSSLSCVSCDGRLIVGGVALGFGGAELSSVGNCSPTGVFGTSLLGSAFLAVIVSWLSTSGILCVDSTGPVILWSSSSCCWRCSALLLWCGALGLGQLKFPPSLSGLACTPGKFSFLQRGASFAIIVSWQSSFGAWSDSAVSRGIFVSRGRWLAILQEWTFVGTFPPLNTFPAGPRPVFFRLWLSLYFL